MEKWSCASSPISAHILYVSDYWTDLDEMWCSRTTLKFVRRILILVRVVP